MKKILTTLIAVFSALFVYAQIASPGTPLSFNKNMTKAVETHQLPAFDAAAMLAEDEMIKGEGPLRFGKRHKVKLSTKNAGTWENLSNGDRIWRITFTSTGAYSLNFLFSKFYIPSGAALYAYNADKSDVRGAFTTLNNKSDGMFAITPIEGETVTLEYVEPASAKGQGLLEISYVVHAYRNLHTMMEELLEKGYGDSGPCNNDVACPESAGWEDQIRSVALIIVNGFESCTGAMVNNVNQDGTPYFLSANHCGSNINSNWTFAFNYNSPTCDGPDGNFDQSIVGGQLRANYAASDFTLFELSMPPPPAYAIYYAGWNNLDEPALNSTAIHHPSGDVKKISFNDDPLYSGSWGSGAAEVPGGNHWIVDDWEDGTTEGGSSGSPIFDQNQLIVGQLHGGGASCTNITYDSYGKFSASWEGGGTASSRLKDWLGAGSIDSFTITYNYDGGTSQSWIWAGDPIAIYQSSIVDFPAVALGVGTHTFEITITLPNGLPDEDTDNNTSTSSFEVIEGNPLTINVVADDYPGEITYEISDQNTGEVVHAGAGFSTAQLVANTHCLDDGCYIFTIYDSYGDGICCASGEGSYELPYVLLAGFIAPEQVCQGVPLAIKNTSQLATSFSWSAPGAINDTSTDEVPTFIYADPGTYTITLTVSDGTDSSMYAQMVEVTEGNGLILNLTTDNYPAETSFQIADDTGNIIHTGGNFTVPAQLNIEDYCLPEGCYTFTIFDSEDDGLCCGFGQGAYEVVDANGNVIGGGGQFGGEESVDFCLPYSGPTAGAGFELAPACVGETVTVNNTSSNADTYIWSAPSATPDNSTEATPTFVYQDAGDYTITLVASNDIGSDTISQNITIFPLPETTIITGEEFPVNGTTETYTTPEIAGATYQWSISGGTQVSGGNTNTIEVEWNDPDNMAYACVTATSAQNCVGNEYCYDVLTVVSVEDIAIEKGLQIFPNPSNGLIHITSNEVPNALDVYDVMGRQTNVVYQNNTINLSQQAAGIYLIRITYEEGSVTRRILVK